MLQKIKFSIILNLFFKNFYLRKKTKICIYKTFLGVCLPVAATASFTATTKRLAFVFAALTVTAADALFKNAAETWRAAKPFTVACNRKCRRKPEPVMARFLHSKKPPRYENYSGMYRARFLSVSKTSTLLIFRFEFFERSRPFSERTLSIFL